MAETVERRAFMTFEERELRTELAVERLNAMPRRFEQQDAKDIAWLMDEIKWLQAERELLLAKS